MRTATVSLFLLVALLGGCGAAGMASSGAPAAAAPTNDGRADAVQVSPVEADQPATIFVEPPPARITASRNDPTSRPR